MDALLMEVRCCCDPGKLLGYLPVPKTLQRPGTQVAFTPRTSIASHFVPRTSPVPDYTVRLVVATFYDSTPDGWPRSSLVLKSMDFPLDVLRTLANWKDA